MKLRSFFPVILTPVRNNEAMLSRMETFGFDVAHTKMNVEQTDIDVRIVTNDAGHRAGVIATDLVPATFVALGMNVEDLEEAKAELVAQGYQARNMQGRDTGSSRAVMLTSPEGVPVILSKHIKA